MRGCARSRSRTFEVELFLSVRAAKLFAFPFLYSYILCRRRRLLPKTAHSFSPRAIFYLFSYSLFRKFHRIFRQVQISVFECRAFVYSECLAANIIASWFAGTYLPITLNLSQIYESAIAERKRSSNAAISRGVNKATV